MSLNQHWMTLPVEEFERLGSFEVKYAEMRQENARLVTALGRILSEGGKVCAEFETCRHRACQSSYAAWAIADAALKGMTPEEANQQALKDFQAQSQPSVDLTVDEPWT